MKKIASRSLALLLAVLFLLSVGAVSVFAENDNQTDASAELSAPIEFKDTDRFLSFDPETAVLTIEGVGNYIHDERSFWAYINSIADVCKTVFLTKTTVLQNRDAAGSDCYLFEKALSALTAVEAFAVEEGSNVYAVRNGVLYDSTVTSLVHYPAGKPDEKYTMESRCMNIRPYAFCNTQNLRFLEFNYCHVLFPMPSLLANSVSDGSRTHFMSIAEFGLASIEPSTGKAKDSSIRTLIWYGTEQELRSIAARHQGNNLMDTVSISSQNTSILKDLTVFSNRMLFVLGLSKDSRNARNNDWTQQLSEAFQDIFSAMGL